VSWPCLCGLGLLARPSPTTRQQAGVGSCGPATLSSLAERLAHWHSARQKLAPMQQCAPRAVPGRHHAAGGAARHSGSSSSAARLFATACSATRAPWSWWGACCRREDLYTGSATCILCQWRRHRLPALNRHGHLCRTCPAPRPNYGTRSTSPDTQQGFPRSSRCRRQAQPQAVQAPCCWRRPRLQRRPRLPYWGRLRARCISCSTHAFTAVHPPSTST
jgi:hypothetical protein